MGKKNSLSTRLSGRAGRRYFNFAYSFGAAIVIIGAMFKLLHLPLANWILGIAMSVEAVIFILAAFDPSMSEDDAADENQGNVNTASQPAIQIKQTSHPVGAVQPSTNISDKQSTVAVAYQPSSGAGSGSSTVVVLGGGSNSTQPTSGGIPANVGAATNNEAIIGAQSVIGSQPLVVGGSSSIQGGGQQSGSNQSSSTPRAAVSDYSATSTQNVAQSVEGYATNMDALNNNLSELNDVYESQLKSIREQIETMKQTNESLDRIKRMYDGAVNDGYTFRDETEKLTKNIEALNRVYERLLQAMTANNPSLDRDRDRGRY